MGKQSKDQPPLSFGRLGKDFYRTADFKLKDEEQALIYLDLSEKEVRGLQPTELTEAILARIAWCREVLEREGLRSAIGYLNLLLHYQSELVGDLKHRQTSKRGGSHPKERTAILCFIDETLEENPGLTNHQGWKSFPDYLGRVSVSTPDGEYDVYRDGDELIQSDEMTGEDRTMGYRTFVKHMAAARKEMQKK